jgi:uncharacterized DUF497 family protein
LALPQPIDQLDETYSTLEEPRYHIIGMSSRRLLVVVYTEREGVTRIISAWKAGPEDRRIYEAG